MKRHEGHDHAYDQIRFFSGFDQATNNMGRETGLSDDRWSKVSSRSTSVSPKRSKALNLFNNQNNDNPELVLIVHELVKS